MPQLPWSEALELGLDVMDDTHREFVDLLAQCEAAADDELPALWNELVQHTSEHFGREDDWMRRTGFAASNCHTTQHQVVLQVMREGAKLAANGHRGVLRGMISELAGWFPVHAQTMDAALALHLRGVGYDLHTGAIAQPQALPAQAITTCGSGGCGG
jgi:hemerythrin-like metal-binding protein